MATKGNEAMPEDFTFVDHPVGSIGVILDLRSLTATESQTVVFATLRRLVPGPALVLVSDHTSEGLLREIDARWPGRFSSKVLNGESGDLQIAITRNVTMDEEPMRLDRTESGFMIDATDLAPLLGLSSEELRREMTAGRIGTLSEEGRDEDAGLFRVTFRHAANRVRFTVDETGTVVRRMRAFVAPQAASLRDGRGDV